MKLMKIKIMMAALVLSVKNAIFAFLSHREDGILEVSKIYPPAIVIALYKTGEAYYNPIIPSLEFSTPVPNGCYSACPNAYFKCGANDFSDLFKVSQYSTTATPLNLRTEQPIKNFPRRGDYTFSVETMRLNTEGSLALKQAREACQKQGWAGEVAGGTLELKAEVTFRCKDRSNSLGHRSYHAQLPEGAVKIDYRFICQAKPAEILPQAK